MKDNTDIALKNSEDFLDFPGQGDRMNEIANIAASSERDSVQSEPNDAHNDGEEVDQHDTVAICDPKMLVERPLAHEQRDRAIAEPITAVVVAMAVALGAALLHKVLRKRRAGKKRRPPSLRTFIELLDHRPAEDAGSSLAGATVVASDLLNIAGKSLRMSVSEGERGNAVNTAQALKLLQATGAAIRGRTRTEELHFGLLGEERPAYNALYPESIASGTGSGVALAVAADAASIGIGLDHVAGIRVHAACNGLWGYRASTSAGPKDGIGSIAGPLDALGWITKDPVLLRRVGAALELPGVVSKGDLLQVIVAEDLFRALVNDPKQLLLRATYKAARAWAGQEEVARGLMMNFLFDACPAAHYFIQDDEPGKADVRNIMEGLRAAAAAVQAGEFRKTYGHLLQQPQSASPEILSQLRRASEVSEDAIAVGRQVMAQAAEQLRDILREGNLLMLPVLPGAVPVASAPQEELAAFERTTLQLSSIAALAGLPQVCIPVQVPGQPLMSVAVVGLQRSDLRLLTAAEKLGPMISECAAKLAAAQQLAPAAAPNGKAASPSPSPKGPMVNGHAKKASPGGKARSAAAVAEAETHKATGNDLFKAGNFEDAVKAYTHAIELNPDNPVYYSNRAMAYLQIMHFAEAEADCDKALAREMSVKTLLRRGTARRGKRDLDGASSDFKHALSLEPKNRQARIDLLALKEEKEALRVEAEKLQAQAKEAATAVTDEQDMFL